MQQSNFLARLLDGVAVEWKALGEVFHLKNGYTPSKAKQEYWENGTIPWFRMEDLRNGGNILNDAIQHVHPSGVKGELFPANSIIMATTATIGEHALITVDYLCNQQFTNFTLKDEFKELFNPKFIYYYFFVLDEKAKQSVNVSSFPSVRMNELRKWEIPIPPLEKQREIVETLDKMCYLQTALQTALQTELTLRKKQYFYYRDLLLNFDSQDQLEVGNPFVKPYEVQWVTLGEVAELKRGNSLTKKEVNEGKIPVIAGGRTPAYYHNQSNRDGQSIVIAGSGAYSGYVSWWEELIFVSDAFTVKPNEDLLPKYCFYFLKNMQDQLYKMQSGGGTPHVYPRDVAKIQIPIPPLEKQEKIVEILDKFDTLANSISQGLPREIELRQKQYAYYRDLLFAFPKEG